MKCRCMRMLLVIFARALSGEDDGTQSVVRRVTPRCATPLTLHRMTPRDAA